MDLESIYALMERFERSSLTGLELEQNGTRLKLDKTVAVAAAPAAAVAAVSAVQTPAAPAPQSEAQNGTQDEGEYIKAPLVGTFYAAAGPDGRALCEGGRPGEEGPDGVHPGGHEDDERDPRPHGLRDRGDPGGERKSGGL